MKIIDFNEIKFGFEQENYDNWDLSYLLPTEINEVLNFPIKLGNEQLISLTMKNHKELEKFKLYLIVLNKTQNFDYSVYHYSESILHYYLPELEFGQVEINYKYATVLSGLGQYGKNTLVYSNKFGFEFHVSIFGIFNEVINLPTRNKSNFNYLNSCIDCTDCLQACPVQAIHQDHNRIWVDAKKCDGFTEYGNHPIIPSIKYGWTKLNNIKIPNLDQAYDDISFKQITNGLHLSYYTEDENYYYNYSIPTCHECLCQSKCSKYNGVFPYSNLKPYIHKIKKINN